MSEQTTAGDVERVAKLMFFANFAHQDVTGKTADEVWADTSLGIQGHYLMRAEYMLTDNVFMPRAEYDQMRDELAAERARAEQMKTERDEIQETLSMVEHEVALAYCDITRGRFSKCNTRAVHIIDAVEEFYKEDMEADIKPYIEQFDTLSDAVRPLLATVKAWGEAMNDYDGGMPDDVLIAYKAAEKALGPVGEASGIVWYDGVGDVDEPDEEGGEG